MSETKSWCQKVLDLLDLSFAELLELTLTWMMVISLPISVHFSNFPLFLSNEGGNKWNKWIIVDFYGICKISPEDLPKPCYLRDKVSLNSSTQAKLEQQV